MEKELLLKKIEEAVSEWERYQEKNLITVGGINFETGTLYPTSHIDRPSDVQIDEFFRNILGMYSSTIKINLLCDLYLEAYKDNEKDVNEMIRIINRRRKKYEMMIVKATSLLGELCKERKNKEK